MKKLLNNRGVTLIELIIAAVILGIIAAPLFGSLLEVTKSTVTSDVELKMNAEVQEVIEEIKATGQYGKSKVYFDKVFKELPTASGAYYTMDISRQVNTVDSGSAAPNTTPDNQEYDRWDYKIILSKKDSTNCNIKITKNNGSRRQVDGISLGTKAFSEEPLVLVADSGQSTGYGSQLKMDIAGKDPVGAQKYRLFFQYYNNLWVQGEETFRSFDDTTTNGHIVSNPSIIIRVVKDMINGEIPDFNIDVTNNTFYKKYSTVLDKVGEDLNYNKHLVVDVYNDSNNKIKINNISPYIDVNRYTGGEIADQYEVKVKITRKDGLVVKAISSTVGKEVKIGP